VTEAMNSESGDGIHHEGHEVHEEESNGFEMKLEMPNRSKRPQRHRRGGFTLMEMLVVIALIGILMVVLASSLIQARNHARRTKSETQLREMITAYITYYNAYGDWPGGPSSTYLPVTEEMLKPLITTNNILGLVLLKKNFTTIEKEKSKNLHGGIVYYLDPWDQPYQMKFGAPTGDTNQLAQTLSVFFPNKDR
jgi:prepilin-type N-terminal cleavage/methylation domain-containing protein